jgi:hypothetical protein
MCGSGKLQLLELLLLSDCIFDLNVPHPQAGVGKSSIINRVFGVEEAVRSHDQRLPATNRVGC